MSKYGPQHPNSHLQPLTKRVATARRLQGTRTTCSRFLSCNLEVDSFHATSNVRRHNVESRKCCGDRSHVPRAGAAHGTYDKRATPSDCIPPDHQIRQIKSHKITATTTDCCYRQTEDCGSPQTRQPQTKPSQTRPLHRRPQQTVLVEDYARHTSPNPVIPTSQLSESAQTPVSASHWFESAQTQANRYPHRTIRLDVDRSSATESSTT